MQSRTRIDVSPIIKVIRQALGGREFNQQLRYQDTVTPKPGPEPNLPPGLGHKMSKNNYYLRDGRRLAAPPIQILTSNLKQLGKPGEKEIVKSSSGIPTPGQVYP